MLKHSILRKKERKNKRNKKNTILFKNILHLIQFSFIILLYFLQNSFCLIIYTLLFWRFDWKKNIYIISTFDPPPPTVTRFIAHLIKKKMRRAKKKNTPPPTLYPLASYGIQPKYFFFYSCYTERTERMKCDRRYINCFFYTICPNPPTFLCHLYFRTMLN